MAATPRDLKLFRAFGAQVRSLRSDQGFSQERLAELAGMDRTYISGVERGIRNISLANISAIARALGVRVVELTRDL